LFASLKEKGGEDLRKNEWTSGKIEEMGGKGFRGLTFLHNTKLFSFDGTKKLYWRRVLESLYEFFKFNLYCYDIFKIKNIVIICINLSFSKKPIFFFNDFLNFPQICHPSKTFLSISLQTPKQSLRSENYCIKIFIWYGSITLEVTLSFQCHMTLANHNVSCVIVYVKI